MTTPIQFTCTHCGYVASTEYGEGLREQIARLTTALAQAERERDRAKGTLVEWLRNMEAPVIRAFGEERWEQARQEIFAEGNAGWTTILGVAAERLRADIDAARAEVERLNREHDNYVLGEGQRMATLLDLKLAEASGMISSLEADLARVRTALDATLDSLSACYVCDEDREETEPFAMKHKPHCVVRAALEGR